MRQDLAFASIQQGDLSAADGWKLLAPLMNTEDQATAERLCDTLRMWTWKALDRRRRDDGLREWIDILNRVEGFLAERFDRLAAKIEILAEMLHESIAVAQLAEPGTILERKHVGSILGTLADREGEWADRATLMQTLELKPANTTRLMSLLVDLGWVEQKTTGREACYRISSEGLVHSRASGASQVLTGDMVASDNDETRSGLASFRASLIVHVKADSFSEPPHWQKAAQRRIYQPFDEEVLDTSGLIDTDWDYAEEEGDRDYQIEPATPVLVHERVFA